MGAAERDMELPMDLAARLAEEELIVQMFRRQPLNQDHPATADSEGLHAAVAAYAAQCEERVHAPGVTEEQIRDRFMSTDIRREPMSLKAYIESVIPALMNDSTAVSCSRQIGHMTGSLPHYMPPLAELVTAMQQNVVKTETAKAATFLEKQVVACLHRLIFKCDAAFYDTLLRDTETLSGMVTSGGTTANIIGLWIARNGALGPDLAGGFAGVEQAGLLAAALHYGYRGAVIVGSALMHYSLKKAADLLGIGVQGLVPIPYDEHFRVNVDELERKVLECKSKNVCVLAIVGIAGATETGSVDDLQALAAVARRHSVHFHVDAAWGGPCLFSKAMAPTLVGIESADTVTIDGHKQLFMPMGCGMLMLRDPNKVRLVAKTASYIIRKGSNDLGRFTLEGSRPGNAFYMHANLACLGSIGYERLMHRSARICRYMAKVLHSTQEFEVMLKPMMNILLYRYLPMPVREKLRGANPSYHGLSDAEWEEIDQANISLQERQKADGKTFVSRTTVYSPRCRRSIVALRVVIGNPLTEEADIDQVISEQLRITSGESSDLTHSDSSGQLHWRALHDSQQDKCGRHYWERMSSNAKLFFLEDSAGF